MHAHLDCKVRHCIHAVAYLIMLSVKCEASVNRFIKFATFWNTCKNSFFLLILINVEFFLFPVIEARLVEQISRLSLLTLHLHLTPAYLKQRNAKVFWGFCRSYHFLPLNTGSLKRTTSKRANECRIYMNNYLHFH